MFNRKNFSAFGTVITISENSVSNGEVMFTKTKRSHIRVSVGQRHAQFQLLDVDGHTLATFDVKFFHSRLAKLVAILKEVGMEFVGG